MIPQHVDNCDCRFTHKDYATSDGIKNLATYEIYYRCLSNGITAGEGTMWKVIYESDPEVARERELAGWGVLPSHWGATRRAVHAKAIRGGMTE